MGLLRRVSMSVHSLVNNVHRLARFRHVEFSRSRREEERPVPSSLLGWPLLHHVM